MLKRPSVIVAALHLTLALAFASEPETRAFKVLVAPGKGVSISAFSRVTDLAATLDKRPYTIRSAEPLRPGEGTSVIVLDFGQTSLTNHACLVAEALSAMARIHESPPPVLVAAGDSRFVHPGPSKDFDLYSGEDLRTLTSECESGHAPIDWKPLYDQISGRVTSLLVFRDLLSNYAFHDAPVRVFWLSERLREFDFWGGSSNDIPPFTHIEGVAEADLTFFPVVFGDWNKGRLKNPSGERVKEAELLAGWTGGFVSTVSGKAGDTLVRALEKSRQGVVLTLEGPVTADGVHPAKAKILSIRSNGASPPVTWQRRFVVNREGSVKPPPPHEALVPLIVPSGPLGLSYGCQAPDASAGDRTLAATLPPEVVAAPSGQVDVYLDYPNEGGLRNQRFTLPRTQGITGSLCLKLIHAHDGMKFQIVVVDRTSGWAGAANGVLSDTKGGQ